MKFKDKYGNVYENLGAVWEAYGGELYVCKSCPIEDICYSSHEKRICDHPAEAARLMGCEVVEDEPEPLNCGETIDTCTNWGTADCIFCIDKSAFEPIPEKEANMDKPLKDWTLEEAQAFCGRQKGCYECTMRKREIAACKLAGPACKWDLNDQPRFTDREIEAAKAILTLWPEATSIGRNVTCISVYVNGKTVGTISAVLFPSLKPGETVRLKDVLSEQAKGGA